MPYQIRHYSESIEDYLEAIYVLNGKNVRSVDIATFLNVSKASVNKAVNVLITNKLVQKEPYGDISLTPLGVATSQSILEKHQIIKRFLVDILKVDEEVANKEACGIEHNISDDTAKKLKELIQKL